MDILIYSIVFFPMAAALLSYLLGRKTKPGRDLFVRLAVGLEFVLTLLLFVSAARSEGILTVLPGVCGFGLRFTTDGFRCIYAVIAALMWLVTGLFSPEYFAHYRNRNRYYLFLLITLGATEAVFLSADLYTTFVFFEIMSLASYVWVAQDEKEEALKAASTYLAVAVIGGLVGGTPLFGYDSVNWITTFVMAVFCNLMGHSVFSWGLKYLPPSYISTVKLLEPVFASVWALFLFSEKPGLPVLLGGIVVLLGIALYCRITEEKADRTSN